MNIIKTFTAVALLGFAGTTTAAEPTFYDSFESGDIATTNSAGFAWGGSAQDYVEQPSDSGAVTDGSHAMRFSYPAGQSWVEKRFDLGDAYPEVWFRFWVRVPSNYDHTWPVASSNRKFFALWMDDYSQKGFGPTVLWSFWKDGKGGSNITFHWNEGGQSGSKGNVQSRPFITYPTDQGRWMQVVLHVSAATTAASKDGVIQMWRRWQGEKEFAKLHEVKNANIPVPSGGPHGWKQGYLMGWANATYSQRTDWYIDEFTMSTTDLLSTAGDPNPPAPPTLTIVD